MWKSILWWVWVTNSENKSCVGGHVGQIMKMILLFFVFRVMSFQREVSSLQKLLLKYIPANIEKGIITKETILKMDKIQLPSCVKSQKVKQEMINMVIAAGKFTDELVPVVFFYPKLTKIEFVGAKITAVFVKKVFYGLGNKRLKMVAHDALPHAANGKHVGMLSNYRRSCGNTLQKL